MNRYGGSGYDAAQDIIVRWGLRLAAEPEFEEAFQNWRRDQDVIWRKQRAEELRAQARTIEGGGRANRVELRARVPRAPRGPGGAASPPQ
eukprot:4023755-Alexandrium_andersonii.AAC.1